MKLDHLRKIQFSQLIVVFKCFMQSNIEKILKISALHSTDTGETLNLKCKPMLLILMSISLAIFKLVLSLL